MVLQQKTIVSNWDMDVVLIRNISCNFRQYPHPRNEHVSSRFNVWFAERECVRSTPRSRCVAASGGTQKGSLKDSAYPIEFDVGKCLKKDSKGPKAPPVVPPKMDYLRGHKASSNSKTSFFGSTKKTRKSPHPSDFLPGWFDLPLDVIRCHWHVCTNLEKTATKSSLGEGVEILVRNIHIVYVYTVFLYYICIYIRLYIILEAFVQLCDHSSLCPTQKIFEKHCPGFKKRRSNATTSLSGLAVEPRQIAGRIILQDGIWTPDPPESGRDEMWCEFNGWKTESMPPPNIVSMNLVEKHFTSFNLMFSYNLHARKYTWLCLLDMLAYWPVNVANMVFLFRNTFLI